MKYFMLILFIAIPMVIYAQKSSIIRGYVRDEKTGESIIGVTLRIKEKPTVFAITNSYGFYSLAIGKGTYTIVTSFLGYQETSVTVTITREDQKLDIRMQPFEKQLDDVVILNDANNTKIKKTTIGSEKLNMKDVSKIPVIMGERDILKTIQLLPGVKAASEGSAGFHVRGGGVDQNLILLDEAPVYNASHLMGFFSVFNADALKDVTLYKGNMPSEYGGRISSVLDVKMKEGNSKKINAEGGLGLIASRLTIQGPLIKDKSSFMVSSRRTYADLFLKLSNDEGLNDSKLYFYDVNAKANYRLNDNNTLFFSGYFGNDALLMPGMFDLTWGNGTATTRWNHIFNSKLFSNTSLIYSNYNYKVAEEYGGNKQYTSSQIQDYNFKQDMTLYTSNNQILKFGINSIYHTINPGTLSSATTTEINSLKFKKHAWDNSVYVSHELRFKDKLTINYGLRTNTFSVLGPGDFLTKNSAGEFDTLSYSNKSIIKTYFNLEPRLFLLYNLDDKNVLKLAYTRAAQNLHLISSLTVSQPTDLWIPSSLLVKPEKGDQFSAGYFRNFKNNTYEFSVETYYKNLQNQIDYKEGAQLEFNSSVETELIFGKGRAYGIEFLLKKNKGKLSGWLGYTLARTEKQFSEINNGSWFAARQDRTHDFSLVAMYELSKRWSFSANWVYYTGNAVSFPSGKYEVAGNIVSYYRERNGYRMPDYHRLDLGATLSALKKRRFDSSWTFSVYNAYARQNPFMMNFRESPTNPGATEAVQMSLFSIVPSITYNFKF